MTNCKCPRAFRYHAINCPLAPGAVLNVALDEKCRAEERWFDRLRASLRRPNRVIPNTQEREQ